MQNHNVTIDSGQLRNWLEQKKDVTILDIRPKDQRQEWYIPGSIHIDAYERLNANDPTVFDEINIPTGRPVVTVCAAGRTSAIAASELRKKGLQAYSLDGGMKSWSVAWNTARLTFENYDIVQFRRTGKGCLSYMVVCNQEAIIVDASLPIAIYERILSAEGLSLKFTIDTHIHADHFSRSKALADWFDVPYYLPAQSKVAFNFRPITENSKLQLGYLPIETISTPGHTVESACYLINNQVLLTGDTLFINSIGRPDLKSSNDEAKFKAKLLYNSLTRLMSMNESIIVLPGHTSTPTDFDNIPLKADLASIKRNVPTLDLGEQEFVDYILQRIPATPPNYLLIVEQNIKGYDADEVAVDLEAGANRCAISQY